MKKRKDPFEQIPVPDSWVQLFQSSTGIDVNDHKSASSSNSVGVKRSDLELLTGNLILYLKPQSEASQVDAIRKLGE
jgi:hypothetical protein